MIFSDLVRWNNEKKFFHPIFETIVSYIRENDLKNFAPGTYEIIGRKLYMMIQEAVTVSPGERRSEHHEQYIDLQYLIDGEELIVFARQHPENQATENQLETNDVIFYEQAENEMNLNLKPGMFVILFPDDMHRASCSEQGGTNIKKAVFKIHVELAGDEAKLIP